MKFIKILPVFLLLGCQGQSPEGQVIVSLENSDITFKELEFEKQFSENKTDRDILETLINRKILVNEALKQNLDLEEDFHFSMRRSREKLLVKSLEKKISKAAPKLLDDEIWIAINEEPWRYKNRTRLYLTRDDINGERTVFWIDTAEYDYELPSEVYEANPGDILTLDGQDWNVHLKESLVAEPDLMAAVSENRLIRKFTDREIQQLIQKYRQRGEIVYQEGYGLANSNSP